MTIFSLAICGIFGINCDYLWHYINLLPLKSLNFSLSCAKAVTDVQVCLCK